MNTEDERLSRLLAACDNNPIADDGFTSRVLNALPPTPQRHPRRKPLLLLSSLLLSSAAACVLGGNSLFEELTALLLMTSQQPLLPLTVFLGGLVLAARHTRALLLKAGH